MDKITEKQNNKVMKKINKKTSYTIEELKDMGFSFDLNGNLLTSEEEEECFNRYIKYREEKLIEKACEWLYNNTYKHSDDSRVSMNFEHTIDMIDNFCKSMEE